MIVAYALMLSMQIASSPEPLPPVETYEFLTDKDDTCIKDAPDCHQMSEPRLFRGTWRFAFEGSMLTPPGKIDCEEAGSDVPCMWLDGDDLPWAGKGDCRAYEVEFVGRRSLHPGFYRGAAFEVVVDRLISAKRLPNPEGSWCSGE